MRITIPLLLALGLAACADEPTEEERAAAVAEVEAHQTPPPEQLEPGAIRYREIEEYDLYGAGCSFAPAGGGVAARGASAATTSGGGGGGDGGGSSSSTEPPSAPCERSDPP